MPMPLFRYSGLTNTARMDIRHKDGGLLPINISYVNVIVGYPNVLPNTNFKNRCSDILLTHILCRYFVPVKCRI